MKRYSLIKNNAVVETRAYESQPEDVPHKGTTWLPFVEEHPDYDSATQRRNATTTTIEDTRVYRTSTIHTFTAEELASAADLQKDSKIEETQRNEAFFEIAFRQENRLRALEGKGDITREQFKTAIKTFLA